MDMPTYNPNTYLQKPEPDKKQFQTATYQNQKEHFTDQDLRELFDDSGRSGNKGETNIKDLRLCFNCLGLNPKDKELKDTLSLLLKRSEDGIIESEDFLLLARSTLVPDEPMSRAELKEAFDIHDPEGNGYLQPDELKVILRRANLEEDKIDILVVEADTDGDGTIDFEEFYELFKNYS